MTYVFDVRAFFGFILLSCLIAFTRTPPSNESAIITLAVGSCGAVIASILKDPPKVDGEPTLTKPKGDEFFCRYCGARTRYYKLEAVYCKGCGKKIA